MNTIESPVAAQTIRQVTHETLKKQWRILVFPMITDNFSCTRTVVSYKYRFNQLKYLVFSQVLTRVKQGIAYVTQKWYYWINQSNSILIPVELHWKYKS